MLSVLTTKVIIIIITTIFFFFKDRFLTSADRLGALASLGLKGQGTQVGSE